MDARREQQRTPPDDETTRIVHRAAAQDAASLAWIIERFTPGLLEQARRCLRRHSVFACEPEDIVQDVWTVCVAALRARRIRPRRGRLTPVVVTFLSKTLVFKFRDLLRRQLRSRLAAEQRPELPEPSPTPPALIAKSEAATALWQALAHLSDSDREILVLRGIEQASYGQIAAKLRVPEGTLRSRYHHALQRIRHYLPKSVAGSLDEL